MFGYVLFDLDGTLSDPKEGICKSVQYALHRLGIEEPDLDKLEPFIGPPLKDSFMSFYGFDEEKALKAVGFYRERFSEVGMYENKIYPGIPELLKTLKSMGVKTAIASSKPTVFVDKILKYFKIDKCFDAVIGSELDGTRSDKTEIVNEALLSLYYGKNHGDKNLDSPEAAEFKKKTVMVGDRMFDVKGAKDMGIFSEAVSYGYGSKSELKNAGADHISSSVKDLTAFLTGKKKEPHPALKRQTEPPKNSFLRAIYVLTPFALYYLSLMAATTLMLGIGGRATNNWKNIDPKYAGPDGAYITGIIGGLAMLIAALVILFMYLSTDRVNIRFTEKKSVFVTLLSIPTGAGFALALNIFTSYLCTLVAPLQKYMGEASYNRTVPVEVGLIIYVLISPIAEEILFRYLIFGRAEKILGTKIAMFASAFFFGLYHGNLLQGIYAFIMGYLMVYAYKKADNLITSIVFHVTANAVIYLLPLLPEAFTSEAVKIGPGFVYLLIGGAAFYFMINIDKYVAKSEK